MKNTPRCDPMREALAALELCNKVLKGIYSAETVEEVSAEDMTNAEIMSGAAIDSLRAAIQ